MRPYRYALALVPVLMAAPAFAQDEPTERPFSGPYVAVSGGYDFQGNDAGSQLVFDRNGDGNFNEAVTTAAGANAFSSGNNNTSSAFCEGRARDAVRLPTGCENDRNRGSYYGRVGFDEQRGPFVLGALAEFGKTDIVDYVSGYSTTPASYTLSRRVNWEASGRLRAGYNPGGNGLFYATGGVGYIRMDHNFTTTNGSNAFSTLLDDRDKFGFVVGGGAEYRFMRHFSIGVEYTYHDYKDGQYEILATRGTAAATNPFVVAPYTAGTVIGRSDDNFRWHSVRAVLGFHF